MKHVLSLATLYPNPTNPRFGTFVARSLEALAKRGEWRVTVVNPLGIPPVAFGRYRALADLPAVAQEGGIDIYRPHFRLIPRFGARRNAAAISKATLPLIERIHAEHPIDVLDAQFFFPEGPAAAQIADALNLPLSIKARGSDIAYWGEQRGTHEQILAAAKRADGILSVSQALANDMVAMGMLRDKMTIHYTGLDRDRFRPMDHVGLRSQLSQTLGFDIPDGVPLLASIGALIARKGQDIAINSLSALPDARLILIGKGEAEQQLRGLAYDLGVQDRVHFAGSIDHDLMPVILSATDVMVLPTVSEGLANAWVEALACGARVVTSDVGGARELITSDAAGRLVPRSAEAVADAVKALMAKPVSRQEVAATVERFDWEINGAELAAHFEKLAASRG